MANVVRLVNGGTIQVRTGVVQGIGPIGPRGYVGNQGPQGEQGIQGEQGELGQILEQQALTKVATSNPISANTDTTVNFGSTPYDQMSCFTTAINCVLTAPGDYILNVYLQFDAAAAGQRDIWFTEGANTIWRTSHNAGTGVWYAGMTASYRALGGETINVKARSSATTAIAVGSSWTCTRTGSGPPGVAGPEGPQGTQGIQGNVGPQGPAGNANSGFLTYTALKAP